MFPEKGFVLKSWSSHRQTKGFGFVASRNDATVVIA
jgi:hypothetical protein